MQFIISCALARYAPVCPNFFGVIWWFFVTYYCSVFGLPFLESLVIKNLKWNQTWLLRFGDLVNVLKHGWRCIDDRDNRSQDLRGVCNQYENLDCIFCNVFYILWAIIILIKSVTKNVKKSLHVKWALQKIDLVITLSNILGHMLINYCFSLIFSQHTKF